MVKMSTVAAAEPLKWRIYYGEQFDHPSDDERLRGTWSNQDGPPDFAPPRNIQVIVYMAGDKREMYGSSLSHTEWYWWIDDYPYQGDAESLHDHLMADRERRVHAVKKGRALTTEEFDKVFRRAHSDPDFPWPPKD